MDGDFSLLTFHWLQSRQRNPMCETVLLGLGKMIPIPEIFSVIYHYKKRLLALKFKLNCKCCSISDNNVHC